MERLKVKIPNLACPSCVPEIEQIMRQQDGVIWAIVNFAAGEATVIYDPAAFSMPQLVQAVDQLGYRIVLDDKPAASRVGVIGRKPLARMQQWVQALHH